MRSSRVETGAGRSRALHRAACARRRVVPWVLAACASACGAYDESLLEPSSSLPEEPAPPSTSPPPDAASDVMAGIDDGSEPQSPAVQQEVVTDAAPPLVPSADAGAPPVTAPRPDRKRLTIEQRFVDEDLVDFPLWVRLSADPDLMRARADGRSLYFTDAEGALLDFEVEASDLGHGDLMAWVRVPRVSSRKDTPIYLYWDDGLDHSSEHTAAGVWSAGFEAVYHLSDGRDSSEHARDGQDHGSEAESGRLAGARSFDGTSYIAVGQGMLPAGTSYTITAWIRPELDRCADYCAVVTNSRPASPFEGVALYLAGTFSPVETGAVGTWAGIDPITDAWRFSDTQVVSSGQWRFVALTMRIGSTEGGAQLSLDGEPWTDVYRPSQGDTTGMQNAPDGQLEIGRFAGGSGFFHEYAGQIDELRIASTPRSAAWIRAEHENQREGSAFLGVETERH